YQEILVGDYEVDSLERLVLPSSIERERRKSNFEHYKDTTLSALFLELMVRVF
uniref:Uncharacterized protein n=1 Tax=Amphimedon queenslandica TaxID=400682 RepID=A0A1X7SRG2_AMPQE